MAHHLATAALGGAILLALLGCAPEPTALSARNPYHYCQQQGARPGSETFEGCIAGVVAARCAGAGAAEEERCERRLRDHVLVTDQLERRGYRVGFDQLRLN
jgi:hypothetical protein